MHHGSDTTGHMEVDLAESDLSIRAIAASLWFGFEVQLEEVSVRHAVLNQVIHD